jgi:hypothetical protein
MGYDFNPHIPWFLTLGLWFRDTMVRDIAVLRENERVSLIGQDFGGTWAAPTAGGGVTAFIEFWTCPLCQLGDA